MRTMLLRSLCALAVLGLLGGRDLRAAAKEDLVRKIQDELAKFERTSRKKDALTGIKIVDAETAEPLFALNDERPMTPASNAKLLTTAAALTRLGPTFCFETKIGWVGSDLAVIGSGDPSLADTEFTDNQSVLEIFDQLSAALAAEKISTVPGKLLIDATIFEKQLTHPSWDPKQFNRPYSAPVAGINFHQNCLELVVTGDQPSDLRIELIPPCRFAQVETKVLAPSGARTWVDVRWGEGWRLELRVTPGKTLATRATNTIENPVGFLAELLRDELARRGVRIQGPTEFRTVMDARGSPPPDFRPLVVHRSRPLADLVERTNKESQNLYAECLFKRLGYEFGRRLAGNPIGSWATGKLAIEEFLQTDLKLAKPNCAIDDGSGLSELNRVTPDVLVRVLTSALNQPWSYRFVESLAVAGTDGTLRRRMRGTAAAGQIRAKTGYIASVSALSGYVTDPGGKPRLVFAILVNDFDRGDLWAARQLQDRICLALVEYLESRATSN